MKVSITNSQKRFKIDLNCLRRAAKKTLKLLGQDNKELSVYIVDDAEIRRLNKKYRHIDKSTDVLAFSMCEGKPVKGEERILGDVVISAQTASKCGKAGNRTFKSELHLYLMHGILHLVGFDDRTVKSRKKMWSLQEKLLREVAL